MNEILLFILALFAGLLLGAIFFGGLWWTVLKGVAAKQPALWFSISLLLRLFITLTGFYIVAGADWKRLLACLTGFIVARIIIIRLTTIRSAGEMSHAP